MKNIQWCGYVKFEGSVELPEDATYKEVAEALAREINDNIDLAGYIDWEDVKGIEPDKSYL